MKKIKNIILFIICLIGGCDAVMAQTTPVNPVQLTTNSAWLEPSTGYKWYYNGSTYLWWKPLQYLDTVNALATKYYVGHGFTPSGTALLKANNLSDVSSATVALDNINGVSLLGSYTNPPWIVSLPYTKITGTPSSLPPSGAAGGSLAGSYPNPTIASSVNLPGSPTTTTQGASDSTTKAATTAFVKNNLANGKSITTTVAGLRSILSPQASVLYQTTDFGGGPFYWNPTDTTTDNTGTVIKPTSISSGSPGRFNRIITGPILSTWFGTVGNGITIEDAAFTKFMYYLNTHPYQSYFIPAGQFAVYNPLIVRIGNIELYGAGNATQIIGLNPTKTEDAALNLILVNYHTDFLSGANRISNISIHDMYLDQSQITPVMLPKWDANSGSGQSKYYAFNSFACFILNAVDNYSVKNITTNRVVMGGIALYGCYNGVVDNYTLLGLHNVRVPGSPQLVYNGNGISAGALVGSVSSPVTYTGPQGNLTINSPHINGHEGLLSAFPDTVFWHNIYNNAANIGIQSNVGGQFPTGRKNINTIVNNPIIQGCIYGVMAEGLYAGGAGNFQLNGGKITNYLIGAALYGDNGLNANDSYNMTINGTDFEDGLFSPVQINGHNVSVSNIHATNWGTAKNTFSQSSSSSVTPTGVSPMIYYNPWQVSDNSSTNTSNGSQFSGNVGKITHVHDTSYLQPLSGIILQQNGTGQVDNNTKLIGNNIDLNKTTFGGTDLSSIIYVQGRFQNLDVSNNTATGGAKYAYMENPTGSTQTNAPANSNVHNNIFHDNGYSTLSNEIQIQGSGNNHKVEYNSLYETDGSRMSSAVVIQASTGGVSAMDSVFVTNNTGMHGYKFGNQDVMAINTTGTHVYVSGNDGYNYRTAAPTNTSYKIYQGTIFYNTNPATGILGWVNTVSGSPGTFAKFYTNDQATATTSSPTFAGGAFNGQVNFNNANIALLGSNPVTSPSGYATSAGLKYNLTGDGTHNYTQYGYNYITTDNGTTAFPIAIPQGVTGTFALTGQLTFGTVTSITPGVLFTSATPITTSGTLNIDSAAISAKYVKLTTNQTIKGVKTFQYDGIGATTTPNIILSNTTASTSGATQQFSPAIQWDTQIWNNTALASQTGSWRLDAEGSQANPINSAWTLKYSTNGGGYSQLLSIGQNGDVNTTGRVLTDVVTGLTTDHTLTLQTRNFTGTNSAINFNTGTFSGASVGQIGKFSSPTLNQTGTSSYIDDKVNVLQTALGSGGGQFFLRQVGGVTKYSLGFNGNSAQSSTANIAQMFSGTVGTDSIMVHKSGGNLAVIAANAFGQLGANNTWTANNYFSNFIGVYNGSIGVSGNITSSALTATRSFGLPDKDGTIAMTSQLPIHGNSTTTGTATTVVTVTIGSTMANTTYNTTITPRDLLTAVNYYISAQTTTTFDVTFVTALTGSINFDWCINP